MTVNELINQLKQYKGWQDVKIQTNGGSNRSFVIYENVRTIIIDVN